MGSFLQTLDAEIVVGRQVEKPLDFAVQAGAAHTQLVCHVYQAEFGILHIGLDKVVQFLQKFFIGFADDHVVGGGERRVHERSLQLLPVFEQAGDAHFQVLHRERFLYVGVCTGFQSVYPGLQSGLGGKQDDGNMAVVQFCLYGIAEFQAVHFGHHHIGYNQIDDRFLQYFQSFHAIGGGQHFIGFGQLPDEKFVHFRIVFHY